MEGDSGCLWCDGRLEADKAPDTLCQNCQEIAEGINTLCFEQLDNLPYGALKLDRDGRVLAFNLAEEELSGVPREKVIGRNFFTEIAPCARVRDFQGRYYEFLKSTKPSTVFNFTYTFTFGSVDVRIAFLRAMDEHAFLVIRRSLTSTEFAGVPQLSE